MEGYLFKINFSKMKWVGRKMRRKIWRYFKARVSVPTSRYYQLGELMAGRSWFMAYVRYSRLMFCMRRIFFPNFPNLNKMGESKTQSKSLFSSLFFHIIFYVILMKGNLYSTPSLLFFFLSFPIFFLT